MSTAHCPMCGETYLAAATVCADCRVALVLDPPEGAVPDGEGSAPPDGTSPPESAAQPDGALDGDGAAPPDGDGAGAALPWPEGDEEIGYDLDDWGPEDRRTLSAALRAERVPYLWHESEVVVPERHAGIAEELIDALDHPDALDEDDDDGDGGAELLSALYVASDVLSSDPHASGAVIELLELAPGLTGRPSPYGVDGSTWSAVVEQAASLADLLEGDADGDDVAVVAGKLRSLVRPLV